MMMFNSKKISELESEVEYLSKELMSANTEMELIKDRLSKIEKADAGNIRYKTLINLGRFSGITKNKEVSVGDAISLIVKHLGMTFIGKHPPEHDPIELVPIQKQTIGSRDEL
jgi:predicted RNase H-like nuclease (RuvC/YqgF family)